MYVSTLYRTNKLVISSGFELPTQFKKNIDINCDSMGQSCVVSQILPELFSIMCFPFSKIQHLIYEYFESFIFSKYDLFG